MFLRCLLTCTVFPEKSAIIFFFFHFLFIVCPFFTLWLLVRLSLYLSFLVFDYNVPWCAWNFLNFLDLCFYSFLQIWNNFGYYFFKYFFFIFPSFSSPSGTPITCIFGYLEFFHISVICLDF